MAVCRPLLYAKAGLALPCLRLESKRIMEGGLLHLPYPPAILGAPYFLLESFPFWTINPSHVLGP